MKRKNINVFPSPFSYFLESKMFSFKVYGWLLSRNVLFYLGTQQIWLFSPLSVLRTYSLCCDLGNSYVTPLGLLCVPFISHFLRFTISPCPLSAYGLTDIPLRPKVTKSLERIQLLGLFLCLVLIPDSIMSSKPISVMVAEGKIQQIEKKCFSGVYMFCVARNWAHYNETLDWGSIYG